MRFCIPLLDNRVAPRCTFAESVLIVSTSGGRIVTKDSVKLEGNTWVDLVKVINEHEGDTLVCSGISSNTRNAILSHNVSIIDNVSCSSEELIESIARGTLRSGYGFRSYRLRDKSPRDVHSQSGKRKTEINEYSVDTSSNESLDYPDCLACRDRICRRGENCLKIKTAYNTAVTGTIHEMLETANDITFENERNLCRLAELVYYCLGMKYKRIGVAFCIDLLEPTTILAGILQRFFEVYPVCCKIGGNRIETDPVESTSDTSDRHQNRIACNPLLQAEVLNRLATDFNVIVGLCIGVDSVFTKASKAPVTTLFVKDKSLANNPIGAIYSDYYLKDIIQPSHHRFDTK